MTDGTTTAVELEERILEAIRGFARDGAEVTREADLDAIDVDSLDLVELAQIVEEEHGVRVEASELERVETVGQVTDVILAKLPSAA
ncbi:MAG: phosphopantetheine-binding protein [Actinomycetota bacterium]|nr:phosphopantetheine-binding protein [Actinomycetota bacterium]